MDNFLNIKQTIIVEGKHDKIKLSQFISSNIICTNGFRIFKDKNRLNFIREIAEKTGIIILTDSDYAGFMIRNYLKKVIDKKYIIDAYIPDVYGKERRKSSFSKEGKLGVEGLDKDTIIKCINTACNTLKNLDKRKYISKLDLYNLNLVGCKNSSINRSRLIKFLNASENISTNGLVNLLNSLMDYEEFMNLYKRLFEKS